MALDRIESRVLLLGVMLSLVLSAYEATQDDAPHWVFWLAVTIVLVLGAWFLIRIFLDIGRFLTQKYHHRPLKLPVYSTLLKRHKLKWESLRDQLTSMRQDLQVVYQQFLFPKGDSQLLSRFEVREAYKNMVTDDIRKAVRQIRRQVSRLRRPIYRHTLEVDAIASRWSEADRIEWYNEADIQEARQMTEIIDGLLPRLDKGIAEARRKRTLNLEPHYTTVSKQAEAALTGLRQTMISLQQAASTAIEAWEKHHGDKTTG